MYSGAWPRARQPGASDRRTGKAGADGEHIVQVRQRHQLALGHAVQVGELHQQGVHALGLQTVLQGRHPVTRGRCTIHIARGNGHGLRRWPRTRAGCPAPRRTPRPDRQREQEADHVAVDAAGQQQQPGGLSALACTRLVKSASGVPSGLANSTATIAPRPRTSAICRHLWRWSAVQPGLEPLAELRRRARAASPPRSRRARQAPRRPPAGCRRRCRPGRRARARP